MASSRLTRRSFRSVLRTTRSSCQRAAVGSARCWSQGAVEVDGGTPRRARLKVIEGFGKDEIHAFVLGAVASNTRLMTAALS